MTLLLQPHQSHWGEEFARLQEVYQQALGDLALSIEHVGSTSVANLIAKPILDIDLVIESYEVFPAVISVLERLGYFHNGDQGIAEREAFKRENEQVPHVIPPRQWMNHHLYVCPRESRELQRHVLFRQALRHNAACREEYQQLKLKLAERAQGNSKLYAQLKEVECAEFIERILAHSPELPEQR